MNLQATITAIEYHLPSEELTNEDLCASFPDWSMDKIEKKTGIRTRHISGPDEFASGPAALGQRPPRHRSAVQGLCQGAGRGDAAKRSRAGHPLD